MQISLTTIPNALETRIGLPRPNWPTIIDWVDSNVATADLNDVWTRLARDWLDALIGSLPSGYTRQESPEFMALSTGDSPSADRILNWCESARRIILDTLSGVARDEGYGKHVVFGSMGLMQYVLSPMLLAFSIWLLVKADRPIVRIGGALSGGAACIAIAFMVYRGYFTSLGL